MVRLKEILWMIAGIALSLGILGFTSTLFLIGLFCVASGGVVDVLFGIICITLTLMVFLDYGAWISNWTKSHLTKQGEGSNV